VLLLLPRESVALPSSVRAYRALSCVCYTPHLLPVPLLRGSLFRVLCSCTRYLWIIPFLQAPSV
jgi:hypothetical protein